MRRTSTLPAGQRGRKHEQARAGPPWHRLADHHLRTAVSVQVRRDRRGQLPGGPAPPPARARARPPLPQPSLPEPVAAPARPGALLQRRGHRRERQAQRQEVPPVHSRPPPHAPGPRTALLVSRSSSSGLMRRSKVFFFTQWSGVSGKGGGGGGRAGRDSPSLSRSAQKCPHQASKLSRVLLSVASPIWERPLST